MLNLRKKHKQSDGCLCCSKIPPGFLPASPATSQPGCPRINGTGSIPYANAVAIELSASADWIDAALAPSYNGPAMGQNGISRLEQLLRETVEGSFGRLFGGYLEPMDVAVQLVQIMEDSTSSPQASYAYNVALHPTDYGPVLKQNPDLADDLADAAWNLGRRYGLPLAARPNITLQQDASIRRHAFRITMLNEGAQTPGIDTTQVVGPRSDAERALAALKALDAFLIVQGKRHVALDKPLVTIGRRPDNDIVLDSATVSRQHAQIRWRFDRFVLYDVSSRGRTKVNGELTKESVLHPGDVIALSDAMLIYGEGIERDAARDAGRKDSPTDTQVIPPRKA